MILLVFMVVMVTVLALVKVVPAVRRWRMAAQLRRDWWPRFEQEFRSYVSHSRDATRRG